MLRVALINHSVRSDNLGVGALTVSEIDLLRRLGREIGTELGIIVIDWRGGQKAYVGGPDIEIVNIRSRDLLNPRRFLATVRRSDLVVDIGAGDSFADIYGPDRLRKMFAMQMMTLLARRPLVMAPQTYGPFTKAVSQRIARGVLRRAAVVASRDAMSTAAARTLGAARVIEASDVALRLPFAAPAVRPPGGPVRVGLNVSGLLMNGGYSRNNMFGLVLDYPALMRRLITDFLAHPEGCEVHLVPHVITGPRNIEDDMSASMALAAEFPGTVVAPRFGDPSQAKTYIAGLDFFAGARMHACIAAFSSGVPVVPMAYSRKFEGLFGSLGYHRTVDCTSETAQAIRQKVLEGFEQRAALARETAAALARGLDKLDAYDAALKALMEKALASRLPADRKRVS